MAVERCAAQVWICQCVLGKIILPSAARSRSASAQPITPTTAGPFSITEASSTGSSILQTQHMVGLTESVHDLPVAARQVVTRRGASSGSQYGPQVVQIRGGVQGGADPTDRSLSPLSSREQVVSYAVFAAQRVSANHSRPYRWHAPTGYSSWKTGRPHGRTASSSTPST